MNSTDTVAKFKKFFTENQDKFIEHSINLRDIPSDDDWIQDDVWDEIYEREGNKKHGVKKL